MVYFNDLIDSIRDLDIDLKVISDNKSMSLEVKNSWRIKVINVLLGDMQVYIAKAHEVIDSIPTAGPITTADSVEKKTKKLKN